MNLVYKREPRNYYLIPGLDPISAAFSSPVYAPPRERVRGKSVGLTTMADPDLEWGGGADFVLLAPAAFIISVISSVF